MQIVVNTIDNNNNDNVSRVNCALLSIPHTSSRIDSISATIGGKTVLATDIDGVDFGRYFQWEDEGAIFVDVDLPKIRVFSVTDSIRFHTAYGTFSASLKP